MKIYLYDEETGIYQGEDFSDLPSMKGAIAVFPAGSTVIAPPVHSRGEVPVFDATVRQWAMRKAGTVR